MSEHPTLRPSLRRERALFVRPAWLSRFEAKLGERVNAHPNVLSAAKLTFITPALLYCLHRDVRGETVWVVLLFAAFAALDYLDGVVARERGLATRFGRVFDRVTDYPLLLGIPFALGHHNPLDLIVLKLLLDATLLVLYLLGRGSTQNRLRTLLSNAALLALLLQSQPATAAVVTVTTMRTLLWANIALSALVMLHNLDLFKKRHVANLLSSCNLLCGVAAIVSASAGHVGASLVWLLLGLGFDGFDGLAARRWGSTSWGVYADDVADGVNFGLAPAAVVFFTLGGTAGLVIGGLHATCTIGRLVYFTLNKQTSDPGYFAGAPSPVGAVITVCAAILFAEHPALVGLFVGVACTQMVSFATAYRHLGRLLATRPRWLLLVPAAFTSLAVAYVAVGVVGPVALLLCGSVGYTAWPSARAFATLARTRTAAG